ncbi:MAG: L-threonylcarbamoyladenylate synthase [Pseudomonadota bacterium]|nr:L-threonylcarbamoyladenylate synthase [Pseudomonadota bacterium]
MQGADPVAIAAQALREGKLVAFPTETVYGLGADARSIDALQALYALKRRPGDHPVIVHLADAALLPYWAREIPEVARALADCFWPGPLTLILKRGAHVPDQVTGGQDTVGIRVPAHPVAQRLLRAFGGGVAAPSANRFGHISPTRADHVRSEFPSGVAVVLEGGSSEVGIESTILDCSGERLRLLRPGTIGVARIEALVGEVVSSGQGGKVPRVSGSLQRHYAPRVPALLLDAEALVGVLRDLPGGSDAVGVMGFGGSDLPRTVRYREMPVDPDAYARQLYAVLRELEACCDRILIERPPPEPAWLAVADRLRRACQAPENIG